MVRNLCCSVLIWVSLMLAGQVRAVSQEVRAAFDDSSTVWVITAQMQKSHWFLQADTAGFSEARLFKRTDGEYRLEISRVDSTGTLVTVNEVISEGAVRSVRARVTAVYHNKPSAGTGTGAGASGFGSESVASLDAGRTSLLVGSTFWGLAYGLYTTAALGADEYVGYGGLIGIGVGYMVPALLTRGRHVSVASSELALGGLFQGLGHGLLLTGTLFGDDPIDFRTPYALAVIVGLSEATAGYLIAAKTNMSAGDASAITASAFTGSIAGAQLAGTVLSGIRTNDEFDTRVASGIILATSAAGIWAGAMLADAYHFTPSDAVAYTLISVYGAALPYAFAPIISHDLESSVYLYAVGLITTVSGMWLGLQVVQDHDLVPPATTYMAAGAGAGALAGLGVYGLTGASDEDTAVLFPYVGSVAGFLFGYGLSETIPDGDFGSAIDLTVKPKALLAADGGVQFIPTVGFNWSF